KKLEADKPARETRGVVTEQPGAPAAGDAQSEGVARSSLTPKTLDAESPQRSRNVAGTEDMASAVGGEATKTDKGVAEPPAEVVGQPAPAAIATAEGTAGATV